MNDLCPCGKPKEAEHFVCSDCWSKVPKDFKKPLYSQNKGERFFARSRIRNLSIKKNLTVKK